MNTKTTGTINHRPLRLRRAATSVLALVLMAAGAGCEATNAVSSTAPEQPAELSLRAGDVVKVNFPGARDLDPTEALQIRRDGKITLPIIGEVTATGLTPTELQNELVNLYSKQLLSKEVVVTVVSASFDVFVDGAVVRSGPITSNHPLTVLEAIMNAGGFDYERADTTAVVVIRQNGAAKHYNYYTVNLKAVLEGKQSDLFYLAPGDMVHVPTKFSWF
jgi:polysaccharide export outer membrane protein